MFSSDFDCLFSCILLLTQLIGKLWDFVSYNSIRANQAHNFKSLTLLLPELHSTQSYNHYFLLDGLLLLQDIG